MDGLVAWLKELAVFIVICETILSFAPTGAFKRYIKPFVGLILLFRISAFLIGTIEVDWNKRIDEAFAGYEQSVSRYLENVPVVDVTDAVNGDNPYLYQNDEELNQELIIIDRVVISPIDIGGTK